MSHKYQTSTMSDPPSNYRITSSDLLSYSLSFFATLTLTPNVLWSRLLDTPRIPDRIYLSLVQTPSILFRVFCYFIIPFWLYFTYFDLVYKYYINFRKMKKEKNQAFSTQTILLVPFTLFKLSFRSVLLYYTLLTSGCCLTEFVRNHTWFQKYLWLDLNYKPEPLLTGSPNSLENGHSGSTSETGKRRLFWSKGV